jgi:hypothetical protein
MPQIDTLWISMITGSSGTDDSIVLIVNEGGEPSDAVHFTLPDTAQDDQEENQANLYEVPLSDTFPHEGRTFDTAKLNDSSVRVGIRGSDEWSVGSCFVWGRSKEGIIVPLALNVAKQGFKASEEAVAVLSTDPDEGRISFCVKRVQPGDDFTGLLRLILIVTTADQDNAETDNTITLKITDKFGIVHVDHTFTDTFQDDLERAQANFYYADSPGAIIKTNLDDKSIELGINGDDAWLPSSLFLFGLDAAEGDTVRFVTPLVHLTRWPFRFLSKDTTEGQPKVFLPLVNTTPTIP